MLSSETLYALFELQQRTLCAFLRTAHQGKEDRKISVSLRLLANCFRELSHKTEGTFVSGAVIAHHSGRTLQILQLLFFSNLHYK